MKQFDFTFVIGQIQCFLHFHQELCAILRQLQTHHSPLCLSAGWIVGMRTAKSLTICMVYLDSFILNWNEALFCAKSGDCSPSIEGIDF